MNNLPIWIKHVKSSVKGGVDRALGQKTLIVGPNGSGKSSITQSVQLATRGVVSELDGRFDVAAPERLLRLFDRGALDASCFSTATFSNGDVSSWQVPSGKKEGKLALPGVREGVPLWQPASVEPLALLRAATAGSDATIRAFFLDKVGVTVTKDQVLGQLASRLAALYDSLRSAIDPASRLTEVDYLLRVGEETGKRQRASTAVGKTIRATLQTLGNGAAAEVEDVLQLRATLAGYEGQAAAEAASGGARAALTAAVAAEKTARQASVAAEARFDAARAAGRAAHQKSLDSTACMAVKPEHRRAVQTMQDSISAGKCLCCGAVDVAGLSGRAASVSKWIEETDAADTAAAAAARSLNAATLEFNAAERSLTAAVAAHTAAQNALTSAINANPQLWDTELDAVKYAPAVSNLQHSMQTLRERIAKAEVARQSMGSMQAQRDAADQADTDAEDWKKLGVECKRLIGQLLASALSKFNAKVQALLPTTDTFRMLVGGEDLKHIEFGLIQENAVLHTALSGAERARVLCALAAAIASGSNGAGAPPFHYIVPDDTGYDAATLAAMLEALELASGQVIIATPTRPARISDAWTVIETARG